MRVPGKNVLLLLAGTVSAGMAWQEPLLPKWEDAFPKTPKEGGWMAGELLLGSEPVPEIGEEVLDLEQPTAEEMAAGDEGFSEEIAAEFLAGYFDQRPSRFLVDPQGLLSTVEFRDRTSFLEYHAGDSTIDLFLYVFGGNQDIPGEVREEEMIERFFSEGRPAAVVFYYLGAPQRSEVYLSPSLTDVVSSAEQRRALQSSVSQAFGKVHPEEQLEAFLVQMSIRIYWMERMLEGELEPGAEVPALIPAGEAASAGGGKEIPWLEGVLFRWGVPAFLLAALVSGLLGMAAWWRSRARYFFPEFDVEPRLGGAHSAGIGAVISFSSAAVPPASQRDQVPDYLRRV